MTDCILVVNPNTNDATTEMLVEVATDSLADVETNAIGITARAGPRMITDASALTSAATHTVDAAMEGIDLHDPVAIIVGAFGDPGVSELRSLTDIPVVGIGEAAVLAAGKGGRRFAIATTTGQLVGNLYSLVTRVDPSADFAGVMLTSTGPLALACAPEESVTQLAAAVDEAAQAGAEAVIIGGGPLSAAARALPARSDVVIIEPVPSAVEWVLGRIAEPQA
ncbi:aspartate/glutamate racemase family protein [Rhodococcus sp. NPDC058639]|uniref:aspartate/glutamate racemase family protein n=1 Tax=Rhodococcus sp. NPDC058639 TaxID=3346570 RepID=UPI00364CAEFE